jgi:hypothetical protein
VYLPRDLTVTATQDAHQHGADRSYLCSADSAVHGYHFGRRAGSTPAPWKKRTSRVALARAALSLVLLVGARRVQRNLQQNALSLLRFR